MARPPIHPGEHIRTDIDALGISQREFARQIGVPANRISQIIRGQRGISAETALRLARWMGTTPQYWLNLQAMYDLRIAERDHGDQIRRDVIAAGGGSADTAAVGR